MIPVVKHPRAFLFHGDSAALPLKPNTIDAIVTDPPAGIGFMGKAWDGDKGGRDQWIAWLAATLAPAFLALKPGGYALVWALPRTSHWTALALEAAGFEIRDRVSHLFGTGFPKSATAKSAGLPEGTGTALKPACEDWWLVRKPLTGKNIAANVAEHGTGALNIDACRIGTADQWAPSTRGASDSIGTFKTGERTTEQHADGRWPAHVVLSHADGCRVVGTSSETVAKNTSPIEDGAHHAEGWGTRRMATADVEVATDVYECADGCAVAALDAQSGNRPSGGGNKNSANRDNGTTIGHGLGKGNGLGIGGDSGGASRFFYCAKPSPSERDLGCDGLPVKTGGEATDRTDGSAGLQNPRAGAGRGGGRRNYHPTVKSIDLMRWLCRLICPPGGVVLDPFAGSGSTALAALAEGLRFVGCEQDPDYIRITEARVLHALKEYP